MQTAKTKYTEQELEEFKALLEVRLQRAQKQADQMQEQLVEMAENSDSGYDLDDFGSLDREREFVQTMLGRQQKHIRDLENALLRIRSKTYGVCEITGELIDRRRLLAVPTTTKSLAAKNQLQEAALDKLKPKPVKKRIKANLSSPKVISVIRRKSASTMEADQFEDLNYKEESDQNHYEDLEEDGGIQFVDFQEDEHVQL